MKKVKFIIELIIIIILCVIIVDKAKQEFGNTNMQATKGQYVAVNAAYCPF